VLLGAETSGGVKSLLLLLLLVLLVVLVLLLVVLLMLGDCCAGDSREARPCASRCVGTLTTGWGRVGTT
jgi:hypothetical protein